MIVQVPQAFRGNIAAPGSARFTGLCFGSAFPGPPDQTLVTDYLPNRLLPEVSNAEQAFLGAFVFDLWVCSRSQREAIFSRPASEDGAPYHAWLTDHDAAFNDGEWSSLPAPMPCPYERPIVYRSATGIDAFEPFLSRIEGLSKQEIETAARSVPCDWCPGDSKEMFTLAELLFRYRKRVRQALASALPQLRQARDYL